jgi:phosphoglycolate phosphatase/AHBA synthesis associated protein
LIRAVLFDLDGVLIDSYELWFELLNAAARELGAPPIPREIYRECWGQGVEADVEAFFPGRTAAELIRYYDAHYADHRAHLRVAPEAPAVLQKLRERGVLTAVITNTTSPLAGIVVRTAGLAPDLVIGGNDVPHAKPAPDMVEAACRRLGASADEAIVVGDSRYDREAARAAGVRFAGLGIEGDVTLASLGDVLALAA